MISAEVFWFLQPIIWFSLEVQSLEAFQLDIDNIFENLSFVTIRRGLEENGGEIYESLFQQVPDWVHDLVKVYCEAGQELLVQFSDELCLLGLVAGTLAVMHFLTRCLSRRGWEGILVKRIAEIDRKLFVANAEMAILQREVVETAEAGRKEGEMVKVLNVQLATLEKELEMSREETKLKEEKGRKAETNLELVKEKIAKNISEITKNKTRVEELLEVKSSGEKQLKELEETVHMLDEQMENQKNLIKSFKSNMSVKLKENENLVKEIEIVQDELDKMQSTNDTIQKELVDSKLTAEKLFCQVTEMEQKEEDWKSSADILQSQLTTKTEACENLGTEVSCLRSRIAVFECECESKEKELQILNEALEAKLKIRNEESAEADGWDLDADCLASVELEEVKEEAKLRIENRKHIEVKEVLEKKLEGIEFEFNKVNLQASEVNVKINNLQDDREKAVKSQAEAERKLEILTEYFSQKEEELHKKLGMQSFKFEHASSDAELAGRKLASLTSELEITKSQLNMLRRELEDQEISLKAGYMAAEKKAQENWIAARQSERRVEEMQKEMSILRNRLTVVEGKKENIVAVINKEGLSFKPESSSLPPLPGLPGMSCLASLIPSGLPNLTSLPSLPVMSLPIMTGMFSGHPDLDMTSHLDSSIAFTSRRTHSMSSISPEESRYSPYCYSQEPSRSPSQPCRTSHAGQSHDYPGQSEHMPGGSYGGKVAACSSSSDVQGRNWGV